MQAKPEPLRAASNSLPGSAAALLSHAVSLHRQGDLAGASLGYLQVLSLEPANADALHLLGVVHQQRGELEQAAELMARSIAIDGSKAPAHSNLGVALHRLGRRDDALASFQRALQLKPDYVDALVNRGNVLRELGQPEAALASFDAALATRPESADVLFNRGNALLDLRRFEAALESLDRALQLKPGFAHAHVSRGNACRELHRPARALASYDRALQLDPDHVGALIGRGNVLNLLKQHEQAIACYQRTLQLRPDMPEVLNNLGSALRDLKRYSEAAEAFARLAQARPDFEYVRSNRLHSQLYACDWQDYETNVASVIDDVMAGRTADVPFSFLAICDDPMAQLQCAQRYVADRYRPAALPARSRIVLPHARIRIAYLSSDFHAHATSYLMAGLFERHDRDKFEVNAISFGPDAADGMRQRLLPCFDDFVDVRQRSDLEAAQLIQDMHVDIAIDLKGFTTGNRAGILAYRPAPLQVSFLGYPGSMGASYMDYLVADARVVPHEHQAAYSEKIVYLPDSYQPNDSQRAIAHNAPTREEAGLPAQGFVFCCFNNNYKITPPLFYAWMRLLRQVPGSVLWLLDDNADAVRNLRSEANRQSVAPDRLVFAPRLGLAEHLARHRLADLFLDTSPCNAHTTASDALWAGLPVLTCAGQAFAGRVAASLLSALDMRELITGNLGDYEAMALRLAQTPTLLAGVQAKLQRNRLVSPLFDTDRFRRHLESAYQAMWQRHRMGQLPASFAVPTLTRE